jgi:elongation factor P hydroxylase
LQQDYEISNSAGVKIGAISQDRASNVWWIMGGTQRFRTEPDAFSYWLANYDHQTGILREFETPEVSPQVRELGDAMPPSFLE